MYICECGESYATLQDLRRCRAQSHPDDCEFCRGERGGVKGCENIDPTGQRVCDYCWTDRTLGP